MGIFAVRIHNAIRPWPTTIVRRKRNPVIAILKRQRATSKFENTARFE